MSSILPSQIESLNASNDIDGLINVLVNQDALQIREAAAFALGTLGDMRAVEPLLNIAVTNSDEHIRKIAADALVMIGAPATNILLAALLNKESRFRTVSIDILNKINPEWTSSDIGQATLETIAYSKQVKGDVFIEVDNPVVEHMNISVVSEIKKYLDKIRVPITNDKRYARTVILLKWYSRQTGSYPGSATRAVIITCTIKVLDTLTSEKTAEFMLYTGSPPEKTTQRRGDVYGKMHYEQIEKWLMGLSYMPPELASFPLSTKKENVRFLELLDNELEVAAKDPKFKPHVMLNKLWITGDSYQSTINRVLVHLDTQHAKIESKYIGLTSTLIAAMGDAWQARKKGMIFVDPEILPKYVRIRLIPVVRGVLINALISEAVGFGFFDSKTRKRYEIFLQNWFGSFLTEFPPVPDGMVHESPKNFPPVPEKYQNIVDSSPKSDEPKSRRIALLLEIVLGVLGLPGIGWLYSGRTKPGIILLVSFLLWDCIALVLVFATSGISAICTIPLSIAVAAVSAIFLNNFIKKDELFLY